MIWHLHTYRYTYIDIEVDNLHRGKKGVVAEDGVVAVLINT